MAALKATYRNAGLLTSLSAEALKRLEASPRFQDAQVVMLYYSLPDEVQTHDFVERWASKKQIILPVVVGDDLELRSYHSRHELATGAYGIEEPTGPPFLHPEQIACIVVPGVAFDDLGNRLGRGKGYYDRLLPRLPQAWKIGLCFPFQRVEEVPAEPFDIRMDEVIS
ncbi:MAG: 5-formyltetrahydrofolate cyclo-ligase [Bacteroides sp.]